MANSFVLTLDTTGPGSLALDINTGATYAAVQIVTAQPSTTDNGGAPVGYSMKIWGSVDPVANANIQATEVASAWIPFSVAQLVTLSAGDGVKTLNLRLRDDVGNATAGTATKSITLDTTLPIPSITTPASPSKISKVAGFNVSTFIFSPDTAIQAYKVKVVPSAASLENAGTLIPTTAGSTNTSGGAIAPAGSVTVTINGTDLETASPGDGAKTIKVFTQDLAGNWSI